jgi:hypothetical protein
VVQLSWHRSHTALAKARALFIGVHLHQNFF